MTIESLEQVSTLLQLVLMFIFIFLVERYVFLELGMIKRKQRTFYMAFFSAILLSFFIFGSDVASCIVLVSGGLNIALARKKKRVRGFLLIIPVIGIINGIAVPLFVLVPPLLGLTYKQMTIYTLCAYLITYILLLVFYFKGKKWRSNYQKEARSRHLENWELVLLCVVGLLLIGYANVMNATLVKSDIVERYSMEFIAQMGVTGLTAFVLTVTVIVLIVQGNKRSYYLRRNMKMNKVQMDLDKAEAANEAKSRFLSTMSHEIRTPMNVIVGMTDILLREQHSEQTREYLNSIKSSGDALLSIINDILDFSRIESGKLTIIEDGYEPKKMIEELMIMFENQAGDKKIEILYDVDKNLPYRLKGDSKRIRQIIINLMNNAIKFTDHGYVKLVVQTSIIDRTRAELSFTVEDTGQGIKKEDVGRLFESYEQIELRKNHHKEGSGLGLTISKQLVDLMGGTIGVESEYGKGSRFFFTVPQKLLKAKMPEKPKDKKRNVVEKFIAPNAKVLLVDDNQMNIKVAKGLLLPLKLQIDTACNGKEAVEMVQKKQYDIVLMDHMMPVMDGIEATKNIRELGDDIYISLPIIALSANATKEAQEMFIREGMNDFVAKPIVYEEIRGCIYKWLSDEIKEPIEGGDEEVKEKDETMKTIPQIEGLDVGEGIKNCGSKDLFLELLSDFYNLIDPKSEKLERCLEAGMIRDYTIEVHALKNTARMIGAIKLSEYFYMMEKLGNAGDMATIVEKNPRLLQMYRSYKNVLSDYAKDTATNDCLVKVPYSQIKGTLMKLYEAVDSFDLDTADELMRELDTYVFPKELVASVDKLRTSVSDVAMEDIMELTKEMCDKLDDYEENDTENKTTIMIIDDDEINVKAVRNMLQNEFNMISAYNGVDAFKLLNKQLPDLILLDVHMPEMDGHDVIRALKGKPEYADIPVVFLTSDEDENTEIQGFSEGAVDFIRKPFRKAVAIQRIKRILELSYLQNNLKEEVVRQTDVAEKRREKVEKMSLQMVQALANTIDAKDSYTNGHSTRVAKYSVMIAERMGYTGEKLEQLHYAALLHDIGKIGVPREIINKPARLTDEEYEIIKTHPGIGANILDEITELPDIAIGARWHHERYDGKGYPDKLKEMDIPELARIIGVADAYDAMTSNRSYRDLLAQEIVAGELERGKGSQFDPEIADIMIQIIKEDKDYVLHE